MRRGYILKKQGNHKPKPNIAFTKNEKKKKENTQADINQRPSNQKKKGRMEKQNQLEHKVQNGNK